MASIKSLRSDINYLFTEFITECYVMNMVFEQEANDERLAKLLTEAISQREAFLAKVNKVDKKEAKAAFKALRTDLYASVEGLYKRLEAKN